MKRRGGRRAGAEEEEEKEEDAVESGGWGSLGGFYDLGSQLFLVSPNEVDPNCHKDSTSPLFLVT